MSIRDGLRPVGLVSGRVGCISIVRDYGDWEVEFDVCIDLSR